MQSDQSWLDERVFIIPDLIPKEQEGNKALRQKLAKLSSTGRNYCIKMAKLCGGRTANSLPDFKP